ncbi:MAG: PIG-L family deacetylase [Geodermatophilaceae bacterium]
MPGRAPPRQPGRTGPRCTGFPAGAGRLRPGGPGGPASRRRDPWGRRPAPPAGRSRSAGRHRGGYRRRCLAPGLPTATPGDLATRRRAESALALERLGLGGCGVHRLGLGDGQVAAVEDDLRDRLVDLVGDADGSVWCLSTWGGDGHPDHEAAGRAARAACAATGARLLTFPIWTWHWAEPGDPRVPWSRARSVALDPATRAAKLAAIGCFDSQLRPLSDHPADATILGPAVLARLTRPCEVVFT